MEEGEGGERRGKGEASTERVHEADRTGCTCRCIGSGGQTGIRAVAPAHLPHPLVAGRRITVPPLPPGIPRPSVFSPAFFSPIGRPSRRPAGDAPFADRTRVGVRFRRIVLHLSCATALHDSCFRETFAI